MCNIMFNGESSVPSLVIKQKHLSLPLRLLSRTSRIAVRTLALGTFESLPPDCFRPWGAVRPFGCESGCWRISEDGDSDGGGEGKAVWCPFFEGSRSCLEEVYHAQWVQRWGHCDEIDVKYCVSMFLSYVL